METKNLYYTDEDADRAAWRAYRYRLVLRTVVKRFMTEDLGTITIDHRNQLMDLDHGNTDNIGHLEVRPYEEQV